MTARHVRVRIARERTRFGDLVAEVACPGCGTRAEFVGWPEAIEIADGHARCCGPLRDGLAVRRCLACQGRGGFLVAMGLSPVEQIQCPRCHGSGREVTV